jgi:hypothetical protein
MNRAYLLSLLLAAAPAMAQTATTLPANVQADIVVVKQDRTNVAAAASHLRADEVSNSAAVPADRTALALARLQMRLDLQKLRQDALPIFQADESALFTALTQLHTDQVANNATAVAADQQAVHSAEEQLDLDMAAIEAGLPREGPHRR